MKKSRFTRMVQARRGSREPTLSSTAYGTVSLWFESHILLTECILQICTDNMLKSDHAVLLTELSRSWPSDIAITVRSGVIDGLASHPLRDELTAFSKGEPCCLPFF